MLVTELSYPKYRAPLTSAYNSLWYSGAIVLVLFLAHSSWLIQIGEQCCMDNIRDFQDPEHVGVAYPVCVTGAPRCSSSCLRSVGPRVSSLAGQQRQGGRGAENLSILPCRQQRVSIFRPLVSGCLTEVSAGMTPLSNTNSRRSGPPSSSTALVRFTNSLSYG